MCRSIKVLRKADEAPTAEEIRGAALQFVRKISGFHKPSKANQEAFERAVQEIQESSDRLLKAVSGSSRKTTHPAGPLEASAPEAAATPSSQ